MGGEGGLRPFGGVELLDRFGFDDPSFIGEGVGFGRGVKGGPMLGYPAFQVDGAPSVGTFRLPLEVNLSTLGVSVGHCSAVHDIFSIAVT